MSKATQTAGGAGEGNQLSLSIQSREGLTAHQVGILLNIVHTMRAVVIPGLGSEGGAPKEEYAIAAEMTLIQACERLGTLVQEKTRWTLDSHQETHKAILSAHRKQEELMQANLEFVEMHKRPSIQYKPIIATYGTQYFIAFWGKIEEPGMAIIGRGKTPHEALLDFDKAFHRTPQQQMRLISDLMDQRTSDVSAETPEEFKKKNPPANES